MSLIYSKLVRPFLFRSDPEWLHDRAIDFGELVGKVGWSGRVLRAHYLVRDEMLNVRLGKLKFDNPVGLAAGFDKNGRAVSALSSLGFGHVEVGSVSAKSSTGNATPRLFRLPRDEAIVVNYGVPNAGSEVVAKRIGNTVWKGVLGINLVETNSGETLAKDALISEFVKAARPFCGKVDYITLNLNCPNTTAGRSAFDDSSVLETLMCEYQRLDNLPPMFLKCTAHVDGRRMENTIRATENCSLVIGFIFNLPPGLDYPLVTPELQVKDLPGTLCGAPTKSYMDNALAFWYRNSDRRRYAFIGSGGIQTAEDVYRKIRLGASLVQVYTAMVYQGPGIARELNLGLLNLLKRDGFTHIDQAVGVDSPPAT